MEDLLDDDVESEKKNPLVLISKIIRWVAVGCFAVGFLFKQMYWPGASILFLVSIVLGCISIVFGLFKV